MSRKTKNLIKYGGLYPENEFTRLIQKQKALNRQVAQRNLRNELIYGPPRPPKWTEKACSPITRENGLYVDVSHREKVMYLGFALVEGNTISYLSTTSSFKGTDAAEDEAVRLGKRIVSNVVVYCDHLRACAGAKAVYVRRHQNPAHSAARHRKGFVERHDLDLFLEGR
jgi:hypothetical protein